MTTWFGQFEDACVKFDAVAMASSKGKTTLSHIVTRKAISSIDRLAVVSCCKKWILECSPHCEVI